MIDRKNILAIFSILLALAVPLWLTVQSASDLTGNPVIKVKINGYDPRDLLHGQYLMFRYDWNWNKEAPNNCNSDKCCLCIEAKEVDPKVNVQQCTDAKVNPTCAHIIKGQSYGTADFYGPPTQYFVDENKALPLETFFRKHAGKKDFNYRSGRNDRFTFIG